MSVPAVLLAALIMVLFHSGVIEAALKAPGGLALLDEQSIESRLKPDHPRLLVSLADFARVKTVAQGNQLAASWLTKKRNEAKSILTESVSTYATSQSEGMLSVSRKVLKRTYTLSLMYRVDGDGQYLDRLWKELAAAAGFANWDPDHFLDTAEMTHAFAIAYDWLYDAWTAEQRTVLSNAIVEKGLKPALAAYQGSATYGWWVKTPWNWNQVCNGGIGMGALAVFKEAPDTATAVMQAILRSLPLSMSKYSPDGGCYEGTLYWGYATYYTALFLASMETALNYDWNLSGSPGFSETGFFPISLTDPLGDTYNFADADGIVYWTTQMFWLARKYQQPMFAWYARQITQVHALDLLWFSADGQDPGASGLPAGKYFRGVETVTFRSGWNDPNAVFVGFKGGDNNAGHSHLDLGSFILGAQGVRWAVDLGADDYDLPGYFDEGRWDYYRLRAEGHNALVINPDSKPDQVTTATAAMVRYRSDAGAAFAIADLSAAYARAAKKVWRGVSLLGNRQVLVQDEIQADLPVDLWWGMHTGATVQIGQDGKSAILTKGTARLEARILAPADASFVKQAAQPAATSPHPLNQASNSGITKLAIHLGNVKDPRIAVVLEPLSAGQTEPLPAPVLTSLAEWK